MPSTEVDFDFELFSVKEPCANLVVPISEAQLAGVIGLPGLKTGTV